MSACGCAKLAQQVGALEVPMGHTLGRKAHAAMDLNVGAGVIERGFRREQGRGRALERSIGESAVLCEPREKRLRVSGFALHSHFGAFVLQRLARADRLTELLAHLRVSNGIILRSLCNTNQLGASQEVCALWQWGTLC